MAEWRHVEEAWGGCGATLPLEMTDGTEVCGCIIPTPDPTSPCGLMGCGRPEGDTCHMLSRAIRWSHRHVPTRCTCGHSIERVPPEGR